MTIEEAIEKEKSIAKSNHELANSYHTDFNVYMRQEVACRERAEYHEQVAEWLEELQRLKEQEPCNDAISRRAALDTLDKMDSVLDEDRTVETYKELLTACYNDLPPVTSVYKQKWIPFTTRPLTEEEKEEHSEWDGILDCKLPDDGQRILVSISVRGHECVQYDEFYMDDGCYLDSGYEIGTEAVAWMPLPSPYKAETEEK